MTDDSKDPQVLYILGQLAEAHKQTSETLEAMRVNLATLNDQNVLHSQLVQSQGELTRTRLDSINESLKQFVGRFYWLLILLIVGLFVALGLNDAFPLLTKIAGLFS